MDIRFGYEVTMEGEDIIHQVQFEYCYVFLLRFPPLKFSPGEKEIFWRDDIMVGAN